MSNESCFWVFGYGSLMWRPGFDFLDSQKALLKGFHRDLCILSYVFRGTPQKPGLVMGLNEGGSCEGMAFRVPVAQKEPVMDYLHEREMINDVYRPCWVNIKLEAGQSVSAYTFVAQAEHEQHVGHEGLEEKLVYLKQGRGKGGTAIEYLANTCDILRDLDLHDPLLERYLFALESNDRKKG